jgi:hypothetical protein
VLESNVTDKPGRTKYGMPVQDPLKMMGAGQPKFPAQRSSFQAETRQILQFKGFLESVPLNTERTTVKPWVGI